MSKSVSIQAKVNPEVKNLAEHVLDELGITPAQAITRLYERIIQDHEWPLELKLPNQETRQVLEETDKNIGLIPCENVDDLFKKLGI